MRAAWSVVIALAVVCSLVLGAQAADKKSDAVKLTGTVTCAKCNYDAVKDLAGVGAKPKACATVIVVKDGGKSKVYFFDTASHKKFHKPICQTPKEGTVTGTVTKEGDKNIIKVSKVEYAN